MRTPWHSIVIATVVAVAAASATAQTSRQTPEWEQFTPDHSGLNSASIGILAADSSGGVWAAGAGYEGINHLNGTTWLSELETRWVQSITATPDGKLLAFANGDVVVREPDGWRITPDGGFNEVFFIGHDEAGNIWSVFEPGVSTLDIDKVFVARNKDGNWSGVSIPVTEPVTAFTVQPNGVAWVGTATEGLFRIEGDSFTRITQGEEGIPSNSITKLVLGNDGTLWVGTKSGLAHYINNHWEMVPVGESGIPSGEVRLIAPAPDNSLWVLCGSQSSGPDQPLVRLVGHERAVTVEPPFQTSSINAMVVDRSNTLWTAVGGVGVARYLGPASSVGSNAPVAVVTATDVAPNPSSESATIRFSTSTAARATVEIVNERGEMVVRLLEGEQVQAGTHAVTWNGTGSDGTYVPNGLYFGRILVGGHQSVVPMMRLDR